MQKLILPCCFSVIRLPDGLTSSSCSYALILAVVLAVAACVPARRGTDAFCCCLLPRFPPPA